MFGFRLCGLTLLVVTAGACSGQVSQKPRPAPVSAAAPSGYKIVLVAGDDSIRVFDNAVNALRKQLLAWQGIKPDGIRRLSASGSRAGRGVQKATLEHVLDSIAAMRPSAGQGCLVFATSHGAEDQGVYLAASDSMLSPTALNLALTIGCGDAPTVVIVSACYSGSFAQPPMTRANRIVLTAARPDRTSFGCRAGRQYTVYDRCLLDAVDASTTWLQVYGATKTCVAAEEEREQVLPSEPQAWFGDDVADMRLPAVLAAK